MHIKRLRIYGSLLGYYDMCNITMGLLYYNFDIKGNELLKISLKHIVSGKKHFFFLVTQHIIYFLKYKVTQFVFKHSPTSQ